MCISKHLVMIRSHSPASFSTNNQRCWRHSSAVNHRMLLHRLHLLLEKLNVMDSLIEHRRSIHLGSAGYKALKYPNPLADSLPPMPSRHALWIFRDPHVLPLRWWRVMVGLSTGGWVWLLWLKKKG
ncbi:hypothetical protein F2Q69_00061461 [Brassica cretica]|uniref:Uncharacterized protein n=1 Tax=Brassica cretica TaxID=69181 RepID=A0A8S9RB23_BRACR|nr:hypothetical protein F2Q69_00061461 [Brassica cretica]